MSQTNPRTGAEQAANSTADALIMELSVAEHMADTVDPDDLANMSDERLVELREQVKSLEDTVESARKDHVDPEVKDRVDPGESLLGLSHIKSHRKYVAEDAGTVIMRAVGQGIDYTDFVDINASTLADEHPGLAEIGQQEYTYLR